MIFYAYFFCCLSQNNYLCTLIFSLLQNMQSHPTWVRGLKLLPLILVHQLLRSHPTWVRGLKHHNYHFHSAAAKSHPTWVRGLKQPTICSGGWKEESHPTWVRGLKHQRNQRYHRGIEVAPYVGAWIETVLLLIRRFIKIVAPYVGAWIETT